MLRSKNLTIVLSVLVAIAMWFYVMIVENPPTSERITGVPVELLNVGTLTQRDLVISWGDNVHVDVIVRGTKSDISRYRDQIIATVNVVGYNAEEHFIAVQATLPDSLTLVEVRPARIRVNIENLVSSVKPVVISFTGEAEHNTEPGTITQQPEQIEVTGPQSLVDAVSFISVEMPYSQINREGSAFMAQAIPIDADGETVQRVRLSSDTVSVQVTLYDVREVPLMVEIIGVPDQRYEIAGLEVPETIKIRGNRADLAEIEYIEAEPVDISGVEITSDLPVVPILPPGVEIASGSYNIHVGVVIRGISNRSFEYESQKIEIRGLPEGYNAFINTPSVSLKAAGTAAILEASLEEEFILYIDAEGKEAGVHLVPVVAEHDKALISLEIIPNEVQITINEDL